MLICYYKYSNLYFCKEKSARQNNNFNQKIFKINLNCFFFVKVEKGRCQFQQTFLNFLLKVWESGMPCDHTPLLASILDWLDTWFFPSLRSLPIRLPGMPSFFDLFIKFVALKSIFIPMYKRTVRPFRDLDLLNVVVSF